MVYSALQRMAVALALVTSIFGVNANAALTSNQYDLGTLSTTVGRSDISFAQGFSDEFFFKAAAQTGVLSSVVGFVVSGDLSAQYRFGVGATPSWGTWTTISTPTDVDTGEFSYTKAFGGLAAGQTYWLALKDVNSGGGGKYSVTLAPVPEPESYAMLLAGLGLIGTIARRRKVSTTTAIGA